MKSEKIYHKNKLLSYVYFMTEYDAKSKDKKKVVASIVKGLRPTSIGYMGFRKSEYMIKRLIYVLFDRGQIKKLKKYKFDKKSILQIIKKSIIECHNKIKTKPTRIFILPNFSTFTKEKMNGISGFCPHNNTFFLTINPSAKGWKKRLPKSIYHEFNHSVIYNYHKWDTLLDGIIFEGFAENFGESIMKGERQPWTKAVSRKECKKYLRKLRRKLNSKSQNLYFEVFYYDRKYPHWLGYTLGYYIVKDFLSKNKNMRWNDIIKLSPKKVLKESGF